MGAEAALYVAPSHCSQQVKSSPRSKFLLALSTISPCRYYTSFARYPCPPFRVLGSVMRVSLSCLHYSVLVALLVAVDFRIAIVGFPVPID